MTLLEITDSFRKRYSNNQGTQLEILKQYKTDTVDEDKAIEEEFNGKQVCGGCIV